METEEKITEKEWYRRKIVDMVEQLSNIQAIKMIYGFVLSAYEREKRE